MSRWRDMRHMEQWYVIDSLERLLFFDSEDEAQTAAKEMLKTAIPKRSIEWGKIRTMGLAVYEDGEWSIARVDN